MSVPPHNVEPDEEHGDKVDLGPPIATSELPRTAPASLPHVRWRLALALLSVISGVIVGTGALIWHDFLTPEEARDLFAVVLTPLFTLLGAVVAFYFKATGNGS